MVGLTLGDVGEGYLRVRGKGGHERLVPMGRELEAALRRYVGRERRGVGPEPGAALLRQRSGRPQTAAAIYHAMRRLAARAGVVSPHTCRHAFAIAFAIAFLRNGGNVLALQRMLGHRDLAMVRRYAELTDADVAAAQATASPLDGWRRDRAGTRRTGRAQANRWAPPRQETTWSSGE